MNIYIDIEVLANQLEIDALKFEHIYFDSMNRSVRITILRRKAPVGIPCIHAGEGVNWCKNS